MPFAGQYWLHGDQLDWNPLRGMADATECRELYKNVWVPADGGRSAVRIEDDGVTWWGSERKDAYDWPTVRRALGYGLSLESGARGVLTTAEVNWLFDDHSLRHERELRMPVERLPLLKLLASATKNAAPQFRKAPLLYVYIKAEPLPDWFRVMPGSVEADVVDGGCTDSPNLLEPRVEVRLDARLLFGMLTRLYNANSVRIGSLARFRDVPAGFDQARYDLFGQFWDSLRV